MTPDKRLEPSATRFAPYTVQSATGLPSQLYLVWRKAKPTTSRQKKETPQKMFLAFSQRGRCSATRSRLLSPPLASCRTDVVDFKKTTYVMGLTYKNSLFSPRVRRVPILPTSRDTKCASNRTRNKHLLCTTYLYNTAMPHVLTTGNNKQQRGHRRAGCVSFVRFRAIEGR